MDLNLNQPKILLVKTLNFPLGIESARKDFCGNLVARRKSSTVKSQTHLESQDVIRTLILELLNLRNKHILENFDIFTYECACFVHTKSRNPIKFTPFKY